LFICKAVYDGWWNLQESWLSSNAKSRNLVSNQRSKCGQQIERHFTGLIWEEKLSLASGLLLRRANDVFHHIRHSDLDWQPEKVFLEAIFGFFKHHNARTLFWVQIATFHGSRESLEWYERNWAHYEQNPDSTKSSRTLKIRNILGDIWKNLIEDMFFFKKYRLL
jgi:hypothetical protein